jgi:hypothetical protein
MASNPDLAAADDRAFALALVASAAAESDLHPQAAKVRLAGARSGPRVDALHFFALLHAERPSVVDIARDASGDGPAAGWLQDFAVQFQNERLWLARAAMDAGMPARDAAFSRQRIVVADQRDAMLTLARSDRAGCALGAAAALAADWPRLRGALGGEPSAPQFGGLVETVAAAAAPLTRRAILFGAKQMAGIHRAVWDLLEAREGVRLRAV